MEEFSCKTKIISGAGAVNTLQNLGSSRLLVVADPFFEKNGTAQQLALLSGAPHTRIYSGVSPDPTAEQVAQGTAVLKAFAPDTVVALGGGSAMDCAKGMVYFSGLCVTLVAIPTTSGSGSEVTDFSILTHDGIKHPLIDSRLCPQIAILDSDLLKQLPKGLIADSGFDVLSHALEAFVSCKAGAVSDALAKEAFCTAICTLPRSFGGDLSVRQQLHNASAMAGMAFSQAGLGLCHALSHTLGGMYHLPHGRLNAILLPAVVGINRTAACAKYAVLARAAGFGGTADCVAVRNLKNGLIQLRRELCLPASLSQAGVDPHTVRKDASRITLAALADPCCATNPLQADSCVILRILEEVTGPV